jgi:hypothetical protein
MAIKEIGSECADWIQLAKDRVQQQVTQLLTSGFCKRWRISSLAEQLSYLQEGSYIMEFLG